MKKIKGIDNNTVTKVFVCQTPFQLSYSNYLINYFTNGLTRNKAENFLLIHSGLMVAGEDWPRNVVFVNVDNAKNAFDRFTKLKSAKKRIRMAANVKDVQVDFFIPHTGGLLANYIFNNKKLVNNVNVRFNLYYEGVLYLYSYEERLNIHHAKRFLISLILGFRYRYNPKILPYNSPNVNKIYTP